MALSDIAALCLSALAVLASVTAIVRQRGFSERQLALEAKQAELADLQKSLIEADQIAGTKAAIDIDMWASGHKGRLVIRNVGRADAEDIALDWVSQPPPFPQHEAERKLPIPLLRPGKAVELVLAFSMGTSPDYEVEVTWKDPDGSIREEHHVLHAY